MEKLASHIPDIWFDLYGRLIPGTIGTVIFLYGAGHYTTIPTLSDTLVILIVGYLVGHFSQPLASFFVKKVEGLYKNEKKYAKAPAQLRNVISKAHAEAVGFFNCFLLSIANLILLPKSLMTDVLPWAMFYLLIITFERVSTRNKKINRVDFIQKAAEVASSAI